MPWGNRLLKRRPQPSRRAARPPQRRPRTAWPADRRRGPQAVPAHATGCTPSQAGSLMSSCRSSSSSTTSRLPSRYSRTRFTRTASSPTSFHHRSNRARCLRWFRGKSAAMSVRVRPAISSAQILELSGCQVAADAEVASQRVGLIIPGSNTASRGRTASSAARLGAAGRGSLPRARAADAPGRDTVASLAISPRRMNSSSSSSLASSSNSSACHGVRPRSDASISCHCSLHARAPNPGHR